MYVYCIGTVCNGETTDSIWLHMSIMVLLLTPIILDIRMYVYLKRLYKGIMVLLLTPINPDIQMYVYLKRLHKAIMVLLLTPIILDIRIYVYLKIILRRLSLTKRRNAIIIVLYFLSALKVINGTCCYTVGTRTEAEFMKVQFRWGF